MNVQLARRLQGNKPIIILEMAVVALLPLSLTLVQLPKTIIPLLPLAWLSLRLRHTGWKEVGLRRPASWLPTILAGVGLALAGVFLSERVAAPLLFRLTGQSPPQTIEQTLLPGSLLYFLVLLIGIWLLAALGEEMVYRGYVLNRLADFFGQNTLGWRTGLIASSLMFSLGHGLNNLALLPGIFLLGLLEGGLYLGSQRNLWLSIVFHGTWDTVFLAMAFLGLSWR
jgi:membrane protease YdiL (CAAX protease family)